MASDGGGGTDNLDEIKSIPPDSRNIVSEAEKQVENEDVGLRDTRKRKTDKENAKCDPEEKPKSKKRRLASEVEDNENECNAANESKHKSKKSKKNSKTASDTTQSKPTPAVSAQNSSLPTVEEVCSEFGLNDVKIQYRDVDYQNLTNYKFFTKHVRPILAKENPKVSMVNMMMLVAAKWRDFSSQKQFIEQVPPPPPPPPAVNKKKKVLPTVQEVCTAFGLKDVKIQFNEADDVDFTKYRFFAQHVRSILSKKNPNVPFGKMTMLVSAKWREFSSQKSALAKPTVPAQPPPSDADPKIEEKPTVPDVCAAFGLKDVQIQYRETDGENLSNYKSFTRYVHPILSKENPKVPANKIMILVAAKWRELSSQGPVQTEQTPLSPPPSPVNNFEKEEMPSVQEVCAAFGLNDVEIDYDEIGDENLINFRSFSQQVCPVLSEVNPKVPTSKILMLVAAKWREFSSRNRLDEQTDQSDENKENEAEDWASKPTGSPAAKRKTRVNYADEPEPRVTRAHSATV